MRTKEIKEMTNEQLVGACIDYDARQRRDREVLNTMKAELQARACADMDDHNIRYIKYYGKDGTAAITDSMSLDILNPDKLKETVSEGVWSTKVKETTETKYKCDSKFEKMLKAVFNDDYTFEMSLQEFLETMPLRPDAKQIKLLMKKLKGDFAKDKETICSVMNLDKDTDLDVELWYIYKIKNAELIRSFLPEDGIDGTVARIKEAIIVEQKTSIALDYDKEADAWNS